MGLHPVTKCIVKGCVNYKYQGRFINDLCLPCYEMLKSGEVRYGDTFIHKMAKKLEGK